MINLYSAQRHNNYLHCAACIAYTVNSCVFSRRLTLSLQSTGSWSMKVKKVKKKQETKIQCNDIRWNYSLSSSSLSSICYYVRWNGSTSSLFSVGSGVCQGSCLSPVIFNMFVNKFIVQLKLPDIGCHIGSVFVGCIMYADDIILLCPSLLGLQQMINTCCNVAGLLSLEFNVKNLIA